MIIRVWPGWTQFSKLRGNIEKKNDSEDDYVDN